MLPLYDISVNCEFKIICIQKMNVIAKSVVILALCTLQPRKEYLTMVTYNTPVLLRIKTVQFDI